MSEEKMFDKLNTALDVKSAEPQLPATKDEKNVEDDYEYTKEKIKDIIEQSEEVLEHAGDIAKETGEARSIEVYSGLMKNMVDAAKSIMDNNKTKSAIDKERGAIKNPGLEAIENGGSVTQNNQTIFVGTTKELHDLLNDEGDILEVEAVPEEKE